MKYTLLSALFIFSLLSCKDDPTPIGAPASGKITVPYNLSGGENLPPEGDALVATPISTNVANIENALKKLRAIKRSKMTELQAKIYNDINTTGEVDKDDLKEAFVEYFLEYKQYSEDDPDDAAILDDFKSYTEGVQSTHSGWNTLFDFRKKYNTFFDDRGMANDPDYPHLIYNRGKANIYDAFESHRSQCYSGTSLFLTTLMYYLDDVEIKNKQLVVIYKKNHVLPGYIATENGHTYVQGIEMTTPGVGATYIAETKDLEKQKIRVIRYEDFIILNIFKNKVNNIEQIANSIIKYNEETIGKQQQIPLGLLAAGEEYIANSSPLGFGTPNSKDKDEDKRPVKQDVVGNSKPDFSEKPRLTDTIYSVPPMTEVYKNYTEGRNKKEGGIAQLKHVIIDMNANYHEVVDINVRPPGLVKVKSHNGESSYSIFLSPEDYNALGFQMQIELHEVNEEELEKQSSCKSIYEICQIKVGGAKRFYLTENQERYIDIYRDDSGYTYSKSWEEDIKRSASIYPLGLELADGTNIAMILGDFYPHYVEHGQWKQIYVGKPVLRAELPEKETVQVKPESIFELEDGQSLTFQKKSKSRIKANLVVITKEDGRYFVQEKSFHELIGFIKEGKKNEAINFGDALEYEMLKISTNEEGKQKRSYQRSAITEDPFNNEVLLHKQGFQPVPLVPYKSKE